MQNESSVGMCTYCITRFGKFCADLHAQSVLINNVYALELSRKLAKVVLLVGQLFSSPLLQNCAHSEAAHPPVVFLSLGSNHHYQQMTVPPPPHTQTFNLQTRLHIKILIIEKTLARQ